jgi:hypothetical protein
VVCSPDASSATRWASCRGLSLVAFALQPTLRLRHLHPFPGPQPDEVRLELRDLGQYVGQQSADRIGGVIHRAAEVELDLPGGQLVGDRSGVGQATGQSVEFGDEQVSPSWHAAIASQAGPFPVGAGQTVLDVDAAGE